MGLGDRGADLSARLNKINKTKEAEKPPEPQLDPAEVRALRSRMLGVLIRDAREDSGFTAQDVANLLGVPVNDYLAWEFGYGTPSLPLLEVLAYLLKIPVSHFWGTLTLQQQQLERNIDVDEYLTLRTRMIGLIITSRRNELGITQEELAMRVDVPMEHLQRFEMGTYQVPMDVLQSISNELKISISDFLDESGRVAQFFELQELLKLMTRMPDNVRDFLSIPSNEAYVKLAILLAEMAPETQRGLAEGLLNNPDADVRELGAELLDITL